MVTETRRGALKNQRKRKSPPVEKASSKKKKTSAEVETPGESSVPAPSESRKEKNPEKPETAEETAEEAETAEDTAEEAETVATETSETVATETSETADEEEENVAVDDEENEEVSEGGDGGEGGEGGEAEESQSEDGMNPGGEEETMALRPLHMYFKAEEYSESVKVSTRCYIAEVMETFDALNLTPRERSWFEQHPQFSHIFHMPRSNHKAQPMWMLLLRTVRIERKKEAWFVVNGVPIRYGLEEHALLSGLYCHNYPINWQREGSLAFKKRHFDGKVLREDVKKSLRKCDRIKTERG